MDHPATTLADLSAESAALRRDLEERTAELAECRRLLHAVMEASPSAIYIKDLQGRFILVNQRAAALMGHAPDELIGKTDLELFPAEFVARWRSGEQEVLRTGQPVEQEEQAPQPDGVHTFCSYRAPIRDGQGTIYAISGISTDITAQRRSEQAAQQSQRWLQLVIDSLPSAVFWKDRQLVFGGCNRRFADLAGLPSPEAIVGKTDYDLPWAATEADSYRAYDRTVMDSGAAQLHIVETQLTAKGEQIWLDTNKIPLRGQDGAVIGVLGTFEEITAQKRTEEALRASQLLLESIIKHLPVAVFLKAADDGRFVLWNKASEQIFGIGADQIVGKTDHDLFPHTQADEFRAKDLQVLESGVAEIIPEELVESPTLGPRLVRTIKVPIMDEGGRPSHLLGISTDLTEVKVAADERATLQAQMIEAQQHALRELSTPLIPLSRQVVLMPIIGSVDSRRARQVMETLLEGIATTKATIAIIDITGVQVVDTQVANAFVQAARAVQLLGAQIILTGIRPEVAQTLVQLGVDLQSMRTLGSLQAGIAYAFSVGRGA